MNYITSIILCLMDVSDNGVTVEGKVRVRIWVFSAVLNVWAAVTSIQLLSLSKKGNTSQLLN